MQTKAVAAATEVMRTAYMKQTKCKAKQTPAMEQKAHSRRPMRRNEVGSRCSVGATSTAVAPKFRHKAIAKTGTPGNAAISGPEAETPRTPTITRRMVTNQGYISTPLLAASRVLCCRKAL
ncbi:hypothetical protein GCM10009526_16380 [Glutamicibacter creatinolyticus]